MAIPQGRRKRERARTRAPDGKNTRCVLILTRHLLPSSTCSTTTMANASLCVRARVCGLSVSGVFGHVDVSPVHAGFRSHLPAPIPTHVDCDCQRFYISETYQNLGVIQSHLKLKHTICSAAVAKCWLQCITSPRQSVKTASPAWCETHTFSSGVQHHLEFR
jgi:hypothetical protein